MTGALSVEHEVQRLMLERLGIEWTPGEPFYSLVEAEIRRLRWLVEWVDENASFRQSEWPEWEKRRDDPQPWLLDG